MSKIAEVPAARAFDQIDGEFEQANFPGVIDALNHGAERFLGILDLSASPLNDGVHRVADAVFHDIGFPELESVTQDSDVASPFPQHLGVLRGFFAEAFEQQAGIMLGGENLRTLGVDAAVADADFIHLIHQLRDQIKSKTRAAEGRDLLVGREEHARVLDRVLEIDVGYHNGRVTLKLVRGPRHWLGDLFDFAPETPAPNGFGGENPKCDPDESEGDEMSAGKRFVIKKNAEEKTAAWRQILKKAECR